MNHRFDEIPYEVLSDFGLTQEMIEDLPVDILDNLYQGRPSPVLPVFFTAEDGSVIKDRCRFSLVRRADGVTDVSFHPVLREVSLGNFPEQTREKLLEGRVVVATLTAQGHPADRQNYLQIDPETRQVMVAPKALVDKNLDVVGRNHRLEASEKQAVSNGHVLTMVQDGGQLSIGIDLSSKSAVRIAQGGEDDWFRAGKYDWEKYTFGAFGCWVMDEDGNLDYFSEDTYTDEMWNEQKNKGLRSAGMKI